MKKLHTVQLSLLSPFIEHLNRERAPVEAIFESQGLSVSAVDEPEAFVPAPVMYALVETLCEASQDPNLAVRVGESMDPLRWPPLIEACQAATNVHEMLLLFARNSRDSASSATYGIETLPERSRFFERRVSNYGVVPRHNDAFSVAYLLAMIRPVVADLWRGESVVIKVCDPNVLPSRYLGCRTAQTNNLGISIEFPTDWLMKPVRVGQTNENIPALRGKARDSAPDTLQELRKVLRAYLPEGDISMDMIARKFEISPSTLKRQLRSRGTSLSNELATLRHERALKLLTSTDMPVSLIASELGYADASIFARAFRRWTDMSPAQYRQSRAG